MSDSYQIDTCTVTVEVSLDSGPRVVGQMFLRPRAAGHKLDFLAGDARPAEARPGEVKT